MAKSQWTVTKTDTSVAYYGIYFRDAKSGYAVGWGNYYSVLSTTSDGKSWTDNRFLSTLFFDVYYKDANIGYIAGYDANYSCGLLKRTTNGGKTWTNDTFNQTFGFYRIQMLEDTIGYACGYQGAIYKTTDNWKTHRLLNTGVSSNIIFRVMYFPNKDTGYAAGGTSFGQMDKTYRTQDGGKTWKLLKDYSGSISIASLYFLNGTTGFLVGSNGNDVIQMTTNSGATWTKVYSSASPSDVISAISFSDKMNGYAVSNNGQILRTKDGGNTWTKEKVPSFNSLFAVSAADSGNVFAAGASGVIMSKTSLTGIEDFTHEKAELFKTYNSNDYINLVFNTEIKENTQIQIIDLTGRIIYSVYNKISTDLPMKISTSGMAKGLYLLNVKTSTETFTKKIIIN